MAGVDDVAEAAKNVAAIAGAVVAVVAVYRIPAINGLFRWLFRRLLSEPLGGWAQKQVAEVFEGRLQDSVRWLAEGQERIGGVVTKLGGEVTKLRTEWADGHRQHGERLEVFEARTKQLLPNGGRSIYDRLARIEDRQIEAAEHLRTAQSQADATAGEPGEAADAFSRTPPPLDT